MTTATRKPRRLVTGTVVSDRMAKTISVQVVRRVKHDKYGKYMARHEVYKAHDEDRTAKLGDVVEIGLSRRLSKTKHWTLVRVVSQARVVAVTGEEEVAAVLPAAKVAKAKVAGAPAPAASPAASGAGASDEGVPS